jgi:hypothetical protein
VLINRDIEFMLDEDRPSAAGIDLLPIFLSNGINYLRRLTVDSELLRKGAAEGARVIENLFRERSSAIAHSQTRECHSVSISSGATKRV